MYNSSPCIYEAVMFNFSDDDREMLILVFILIIIDFFIILDANNYPCQ